MTTLLDKEYFKKLEKIMSAKIVVANSTKKNINNNKDISVFVNLKDSNNKLVSQLEFHRPFTINFQTTRYILGIIILAFVLNLVVNLYYSKKWIFNQLKLITSILENGNKKAIKELKKTQGEFGYIGNLFSENILQRKQLEKSKTKAEESDKLKSAFLANLSHEIRTPMNAIIGFSDLLNNHELSCEEKKEYLNVIHQSGNNLISIIDDLIEMSKIDSNLINPNYSGIDINLCAEQIYNAIKITIPKDKKIDFSLVKCTTNF